jgi:hypothetical protein
MYGYLYRNTFNSSNPSENLLSDNDADCGQDRLWLNTSLSSNMTYMLVVTTYAPAQTGAFVIEAFGSAEITFTRISK